MRSAGAAIHSPKDGLMTPSLPSQGGPRWPPNRRTEHFDLMIALWGINPLTQYILFNPSHGYTSIWHLIHATRPTLVPLIYTYLSMCESIEVKKHPIPTTTQFSYPFLAPKWMVMYVHMYVQLGCHTLTHFTLF